MISGTKRAAVYDPSDGTVVQFNNLMPEGDFKVRESLEDETGVGNTIFSGEKSTVSFFSFDVSAYSQLNIWSEAETPLRLVIEGVENHILWYEDVAVKVEPHYKGAVGELNGISITFHKKGGLQSVYNLKNLLIGAIGAPWATDSNNDGIVDGIVFSLVSGAEPDYSIFYSRYQGITSAGTGEITATMQIEFPLAGVELTAFPNIYLNDNTFNSHTLKAVDFSGTVLASATSTNPEETISITTPANTYKIIYELADITLGDAGKITNIDVPYLGTDAENYQDICEWGFATDPTTYDRVTSSGDTRTTSIGNERIAVII